MIETEYGSPELAEAHAREFSRVHPGQWWTVLCSWGREYWYVEATPFAPAPDERAVSVWRGGERVEGEG